MKKNGFALGIILVMVIPVFSQIYQDQDTHEAPACIDPYSVRGTKEVVGVYSPGLEGNLLGDSPYRSVSIYLPPGYEDNPANSYPVLYFLHGILSDHTSFFGGVVADVDFEVILNTLYNSEAVPPLIVVAPNSRNTYGGSFYTNSYVTGQWEDFIVKDVVQFVEENYRTIPSRGSRGLAGHSMGGYGTFKLSMKHPSLFNASYALSPGALIFDLDSAMVEFINEAASAERFDNLSTTAKGIVMQAAAFAPDSTALPFYGQFPVDTSGNRIDSVWQKWLQHDPCTMLPTHKDSLLKLAALQYDCGMQDQYLFYPFNAKFSDTLDHFGVDHVFEPYTGDHGNKLAERIEMHLLPFFFEHLEHVVPGIIRKSARNLESSDTLMIELDLNGTVYVVPQNTEPVLDSILEKQIISQVATAKSDELIPLSGIEYGEYMVYGVDESQSGISLPVPFAVVPFIPEITIRMTDFGTGDPISACELNIDGKFYMTDSDGEVSFKGCGENNSYSISVTHQSSTLDTSLVAYSDTTFIIPMVEDSYLKFLDRSTGEHIPGVKLFWGNNTLYTGEDGIVPIFNRRNESLIFSAERMGYFTHEDSTYLRGGDTLIVELTKLQARLEFQVLDGLEPVSDQTIQLGIFTNSTDQDGLAVFYSVPARLNYPYQIERPCYFPIYDTLFLKIDTLVQINLEPDTIPPVLDMETSGDTLLITCSATGDFYVVPPDTEPIMDSILANLIITLPVTTDDTTFVNTSDLPDGAYWVYVIDLCSNISEELTIGVGSEEFSEIHFRIYPNPVKNVLVIEPFDFGEYTIDITSVNGRIIHSQRFSGTTYQLDLSSFQKGIYFITIRSQDFVTTRKIVKM